MKPFRLIYCLLLGAFFLCSSGLHSSAFALNPIAEKNLQRQARQFLHIVRENKQFSDDLIINAYVLDLAEKLATSAGLDIQPLHYYVLIDSQTNAFAGPGATFFLNSGLIELAGNEAELIAVMAHELAHYKQDHLNRLLTAYKSTQVPSILAVLAGLLIGGDAGFATILGAQAARVESVIEHTLAYEREADNAAVGIMVAAQYDPIHARNFMVALEQEMRERGVIQPNIHNTHPVTPERIASINARLLRYKNHSFPELTANFLYFKARTRVLFKWESNKTFLYFEKKLTKGTKAEQLANAYGYALSLAKDGNAVKAKQTIDALISEQPNNLWVILAQAEFELKDNPATTLSILEDRATAEYPHPAVIELYTKSLLSLGHYEQAYQYLRKHRAAKSKYNELLKLNAKTAIQSGQLGEGYLADADYHFRIGDLQIALNQLKFAERTSDDFVTVSIAREKIRRISEEIEWREN